MAAVHDQEVHQSAAYTLEFTIYQTKADEDAGNTNYRDLTGYATPVYRVGSLANDVTDLQVNGQLSDPANGKIQVSLSAVQTAALSVGKHNHQLVVTDNSSNPQVSVDGYLTVKEALPAA